MKRVLPKIEARVRPHRDERGRETRLLAFAELTIADAFVIKGIKILERDAEKFVVFPAEKGKGDKDRWYDVAHPCTLEARDAAVRAILDAYDAAKRSSQ